MTKRDLASIVCRVLALVLAVWAVEGAWLLVMSLGGLIGTLDSARAGVSTATKVWITLEVIGSAIRPLLYGAIAWFAWCRTSALAALLAGRHPDDVIAAGLRRDDLLIAAFAVVGLVLAATGIADLGGAIAKWAAPRLSETRPAEPLLVVLSAFVGPAIRSSLGIWLLLGPTGVLELVRRLRQSSGAPARVSDAAPL